MTPTFDAAVIAGALVLALGRLLLPPPRARRPDIAPATLDASPAPRPPQLSALRLRQRRTTDPVTTARALAVWCEDTARRVRSGDTLSTASATTRPAGIAVDKRLVDGVLADLSRHGGPSAEVLDRCAERLRARAADRREVRLQSAPARLSARIMTFLPIATVCLLTATTPGVRTQLASGPGIAASVLGGSLNLAGWWWMRRLIGAGTRRRDDPVGHLAEPIESVMLAVRSGRSLGSAIDGIVESADPELEPHLVELRWRIVHGWTLADALAGFGDRLGARGRSMIDGLISAERYGGPLTPVLDRMVDEIDDDRRDHAARLASTLPVRLSAPLVVCTLPSFVLIALAPAVAAALASLRGGPLALIGP